MNILDFDISITLTDEGNLDQVLIAYGEESTLLRRNEIFELSEKGDLLASIIVKRLSTLKLAGRLTINPEKHVVSYGGGGGGGGPVVSYRGARLSRGEFVGGAVVNEGDDNERKTGVV